MKAHRVRYFPSLRNIDEIPDEEKERLKPVTDRFPFRANSYYLGLINWKDPDDPLRKIVIPSLEEFDDDNPLDPSFESLNVKVTGVQHKYSPTALVLVSRVCGGICRFCFRKRLFMGGEDELAYDISCALNYVWEHPEIDNVLLSGGDPLALSTRKIERIISRFREIPHVRIIRLGSKIPAYDPYRLIDDPELIEVLSNSSDEKCRIYVITHFNHPREMTPAAREAISLLQSGGISLSNQTPLLRGINDDADTLAELFNNLSYWGIPPYYVFQCRPARGNDHFALPLGQAYEIFEEAKRSVSGLAKRAKYVMSHATGKIEIVGLDYESIFLKYHQARNPEDIGRFFSLPYNETATWLDDLVESETEGFVEPEKSALED